MGNPGAGMEENMDMPIDLRTCSPETIPAAAHVPVSPPSLAQWSHPAQHFPLDQ
jgi:hypothetical protein